MSVKHITPRRTVFQKWQVEELIITRSALHDMLKGDLQVEIKEC